MADLKPCPFCGSDNVDYLRPSNYWFVVCNACEAEGPVEYSEGKAAEVWNHRTAPADKQGGGLSENDEAKVRAILDDPMWSHHAEIHKSLLRRVLDAAVLARVAPSDQIVTALQDIKENASKWHPLHTPQPREKQAEHQCECNACHSSRAVRGYTIPENCEQPAEEARGYEFKPSRHDKGAVIWAVATMLRKWSALGDNLAAHDDFTTAMAQTMIEYDSVAKTAEEARGVDTVTRESAIAAIRHVERHNGPGRASEAIALLAAPAAATAQTCTAFKCEAAERDGILCSDESCDIATGVRAGAPAQVPPIAAAFARSYDEVNGPIPQPATGAQGLTDEQIATIKELLQCFLAWDKDVRVLGNVRAEDAADAMRAMLTQAATGAQNLAAHLDNMLRLIKENRRHINYQAGSPNDEEVKAARRALMDWTSAASQPHGGKDAD